MQDSEVYGWLVKNEPDGLVAVDEKEQAVFEQKLGLKQKWNNLIPNIFF